MVYAIHFALVNRTYPRNHFHLAGGETFSLVAFSMTAITGPKTQDCDWVQTHASVAVLQFTIGIIIQVCY